MKDKACKECNRLTRSDVCSACDSPTSSSWVGYVSIIDPERSQIAKRLNITTKGRYALRVR
jgi:DNA-directed RNA polymerase subunit E"